MSFFSFFDVTSSLSSALPTPTKLAKPLASLKAALLPHRGAVLRPLGHLKRNVLGSMKALFQGNTLGVGAPSLWTKGNLTRRGSAVETLIAYNTVGQPVWTPRQYEALAHEGYEKNIIVYRCVTLIARALAGVPLCVHLQDKRMSYHPLVSPLRNPNPRQSGGGLMESLVSSYLLSGNSYLEAVAAPTSALPVELYTLRADRMRVIPGARGLAHGYEYHVNGRKRLLLVEPTTGTSSVLHLKTFHPLNDWYGMSPIEAAAMAVDQHNAVSSHNLALLQNGGRPSGALLLKTPHHPLTPEQKHSLRQDLKVLYEGPHNAGRIALLEGDFEWRDMGLSPKDLDFVAGKNTSAREIAQAYGVPPILVGVHGDATFANYREARCHLWEDTLLPLLDLITEALTSWLAPRFQEDLRITYDRDAISALSSRREALWGYLSQATFLTDDEKRQALGYPPRHQV